MMQIGTHITNITTREGAAERNYSTLSEQRLHGLSDQARARNESCKGRKVAESKAQVKYSHTAMRQK